MDVKRVLFLVAMLFVTLVLPYYVYGTNGSFEMNSIIYYISFNAPESRWFFQFLPHVDFIIPALLICAPCILWLSKMRNMSVSMLLGSVGIVLSILILILLLYLPPWEVLPWFFQNYYVILIVPEFIDLNPFAGLAFSILILLPSVWQGLSHTQSEDRTKVRSVIVAALSFLVLLFPFTMENRSWFGFDRSQSFFFGFSLFSVTSKIYYNVDGNFMGYNTWYYFSMSSISEIIIPLLLILPGIIFVWFVCRFHYNREDSVFMITAGAIHLLVVSLYSNWINNTSTHAGTWLLSPFPIFLFGGAVIASVYGVLQLNRGRVVSISKEVPEPANIQQA